MDIKIWDGGYVFNFLSNYYPQLDFKVEYPSNTYPFPPIRKTIKLLSPDTETFELLGSSVARFNCLRCRKRYKNIDDIVVTSFGCMGSFNKLMAKSKYFFQDNYIFNEDKKSPRDDYRKDLEEVLDQVREVKVIDPCPSFGSESNDSSEEAPLPVTNFEYLVECIKEDLTIGNRYVLVGFEKNYQPNSFRETLIGSLRKRGLTVEKLWE